MYMYVCMYVRGVTDRHSFSDVVEVENTQQLVDLLLLHHVNSDRVHRSRLQTDKNYVL